MTLLNIKNKKIPNYFSNSKQTTKHEINYHRSNLDQNKDQNYSNSLIIGEGVSITGSIKADNEVTVQGAIDGDINCNNITIHKTGMVKGKIKTENMTVEGNVEGEFNINSILHIKSKGSVNGKVFYDNIQIDQGGTLEGEIKSEENKKNTNEKLDWKAL